MLLPDCTRWIGNFRTGLLPGILKGLRHVVTLSSLLMKVGMGFCRNIGIGQDIVVGSGVEASSTISSSRIRSTLPSSGPVCITSIQAGWRGACDRLGWVFASLSSSMMCSTTSPTGIFLLVVTSSATHLGGNSYPAWGGISSASLVGSEGPGWFGFVEVSVGADSFPHLVRLGMSPDMLETCSSGTARLISSARPSKRLLISSRSSSIFSTKSTKMEITFAVETGFFARLLSKSQALFSTSPGFPIYSFNF